MFYAGPAASEAFSAALANFRAILAPRVLYWRLSVESSTVSTSWSAMTQTFDDEEPEENKDSAVCVVGITQTHEF